MNTKQLNCAQIQERMSWEKDLRKEEKEHILQCSQCSKIALQIEEINNMAKNIDIYVPADFADTVMGKIQNSDQPNVIKKFEQVISKIIQTPGFRWGIGGASFIVAFAAH